MNSNPHNQYIGIINRLKGCIETYCRAQKEAEKKNGVNIFRLVSDYYYRENFHGDILEFLMDNSSESQKFTKIFVELVEKKMHEKKFIDYYHSPELYREVVRSDEKNGKRRIDFVIEGARGNQSPGNQSKKHCIIIENKLNDAPDTFNQLPAYKELMEGEYEIDALVYLPFSDFKQPDRSTWSKNVDIDKFLCVITASELIDEWLEKCKSNSEDTRVIIKHYIELLKSLKPNPAMEQFMTFIKKNPSAIDEINTICEMRRNFERTLEDDIFNKVKDLNPYQQDRCYCIIKLPNNDTIYVSGSFSKDKAYTIAIVINDEWKLKDNNIINGDYSDRHRLYGSELMSWGSDTNNNYRFIKTYGIDQGEDVAEFLKKISQKIEIEDFKENLPGGGIG